MRRLSVVVVEDEEDGDAKAARGREGAKRGRRDRVSSNLGGRDTKASVIFEEETIVVVVRFFVESLIDL